MPPAGTPATLPVLAHHDPRRRPMTSTLTGSAATVGAIYEAFGRGDVPAILERLAEDVAWDPWPDNFAQRAGVPHLVARHGRDHVAGVLGGGGADGGPRL